MEKDKYFTSEEQAAPQSQDTQTQFSADLEKIRDAMLKQLEPFETPEKIKKLKRLVEKGGDTIRILAGLAARILIIREKLSELANYRLGKTVSVKPKETNKKEKDEVKEEPKNEEDKKKNWISVRTVQQGDINGIDLDEGVQIKVSPEDVDRLTKAGLVEIVTSENKEASKEEEAEAEKTPAKKGKKGKEKSPKTASEEQQKGKEKKPTGSNNEKLAEAVAEAEAEAEAEAKSETTAQTNAEAKTDSTSEDKEKNNSEKLEEEASTTEEANDASENDSKSPDKGKLKTENIGEIKTD